MSANAINEQIQESGDANENKFLSFCLKEEEYGVEILRVREIIGVMDITPLPQTPPSVKGVINLRGKIIPVIELRAAFGMETQEYTEETCVIVVEVSGRDEDERHQIGVLVDTVREVIDIPRDQIEPAPRFGSQLRTDVISGMGKVKERVLILLDIDRILTGGELVAECDLAAATNSQTAGDPAEAA